MSAPLAEGLQPPISNVAEVFEPYLSRFGHHDAEIEKKLVRYAAPYQPIAAQDPSFFDLFPGISEEAAITFTATLHPGLGGASSILFHLHERNPDFTDALIANETACRIVGTDILKFLGSDHPAIAIGPSDIKAGMSDQDIISLGKITFLETMLEATSWKIEDMTRIAQHSMPELAQAISHRWAIIEDPQYVELVNVILADPALAPEFTKAVLGRRDPLEGVRNAKMWCLNYSSAKRHDITKVLYEHPLFDDEASRIADQALGREYVGYHIYCAVRQRLEAGETPTDISTALRDQRQKIGQMAVDPDAFEAYDANDGLSNELMRSVLRWHEFSDGSGRLSDMIATIRTAQKLPPSLQHSRYSPSSIRRIEVVEQPNRRLTKDMIERMDALSDALEIAFTTRDEMVLNRFVDGGRDAVRQATFADLQAPTIKQIDAKLGDLLAAAQARAAAADPAARPKIEFQVDQLTVLTDYNWKCFPHDIAGLAKYRRDIGPELTVLLLHDVPFTEIDHIEWHEQRDVGSLNRIREAIQHQGIAALFNKNPTLSPQDRQAITGVLSTRAFQPLFAEQKRTGKTLGLQFLPARGMLLEASGYIAHACWADRMIVSKQHPNVDAVIFRQTGDKTGANATKEGFVGGCLLIHTENTDGEPLLIIRGLNPMNAFIDKVDVADFYKELTDYVTVQAKAHGRKPAIVIDGGAGQAASNRPTVFDFLAKQKQHLKRTTVAPDDTTFNGYNIEHDVYLLPEAETA